MKSPQLKIVHVIARLNVGGPSVVVIAALEELRKRGHQVLLVAGEVSPGEASMEYLAEEKKLAITRIPQMSRKLGWWNDLVSFAVLCRILRRERPHVVHTHTAKAGTLGRLAALFNGVPVRIHMFHGHVFRGYFSKVVTRAFIVIERALATCSDRLIVLSPSQKNELAGTFRIAPPEKVVTIPLGLTQNSTESTPGGRFRNSIACPRDCPLVGWVGRLTAIKGPELFIAAAGLLQEAVPKAKFAIVGDGELRAMCQSLIRKENLQACVHLTGWRHKLESVYSDLDVLVLTSINEGTPLVLLEAMAAARPFVAVDVGGVRDLMTGVVRSVEGVRVFENGILVPREPHMVARAVQHVIENPEYGRRMGQIGREFVRTYFSVPRMVDDFEALYLQILRSKGCTPQPSTAVNTLPL